MTRIALLDHFRLKDVGRQLIFLPSKIKYTILPFKIHAHHFIPHSSFIIGILLGHWDGRGFPRIFEDELDHIGLEIPVDHLERGQ